MLLMWLLLLLLLLGNDVGLGLGRGQIGLAFLKMLNLTRRILCADVAAVKAADFVTFGWCVSVLKLGIGAPYIGVGVSAHDDLCLPRLALRRWRRSGLG